MEKFISRIPKVIHRPRIVILQSYINETHSKQLQQSFKLCNLKSNPDRRVELK